MEKTKEKQTIYERLVELTENAEPNEYFSKSVILAYIRDAIETETASEILPSTRKAEGFKVSEEGEYVIKNGEVEKVTIGIDEMLPKQKSMRPLLEELAKEGKVEKVVISDMGYGYRAKKFSRSL